MNFLELKCFWAVIKFVPESGWLINKLRPRQIGHHFSDDIFKCIFLNENVEILIKISLKFVPKGPIYNIPALVQILSWCRPGAKPLSEPSMMVSLLTHICVTRPPWVNDSHHLVQACWARKRRQANTWSNVVPDLRRHMASLGHKELILIVWSHHNVTPHVITSTPIPARAWEALGMDLAGDEPLPGVSFCRWDPDLHFSTFSNVQFLTFTASEWDDWMSPDRCQAII